MGQVATNESVAAMVKVRWMRWLVCSDVTSDANEEGEGSSQLVCACFPT